MVIKSNISARSSVRMQVVCRTLKLMLQLILYICLVKKRTLQNGICGHRKCVSAHAFYGGEIWLAVLTRERSIVSDKASQVQRLVVNVQLLHTADKLPGAKWEVVWYIGNSTQKQWTSQVQRPERGEVNKVKRK